MSNNKQFLLLLVIGLFVLVQNVDSVSPKSHPALDNEHYCVPSKGKSRILKGFTSKHADFPSFVFLSMRQFVNGNIEEKECGSVVIGRRYLLTSASCLMTPDMKRKIVSGTAWITDKKGERKGYFTGAGIAIQAFCVPTAYRRDPFNKLYHEDLAVVKLAGKFVFNSTTQPACIPESNCTDCSNLYKLPGFGRTLDYDESWSKNNTMAPNITHKIEEGKDMKFIKLTGVTCEEPFNSDFLCLEPTESGMANAACIGDEGGPVISIEKGVSYVQGIVTDQLVSTCDPERTRVTHAARLDTQSKTIKMLLDECMKIAP